MADRVRRRAAHPTLNRHSPAEVVANFKRRVPPRLPKPRKRDTSNDIPMQQQPRSAVGMGPIPLSTPSGMPGSPGRRSRGFSAPGSFTPLAQPGAGGWGTSYSRQALPPLTVPDTHPSSMSAHGHNGMYGHGHPLTPADEPPQSSTSAFTPLSTYSNGPSAANGRADMLLPSPNSAYPYPEQNGWSFSPGGSAASSHSSGSLSSLLNPNTSGGAGSYGSRPGTGTSSYQSGYAISSMSRGQYGGGASPDSRPTTGYSMSSVSSMAGTPYEEAQHFDYSRPGSSHRPLTPASSRPPSSKAAYGPPPSLSVRRDRRHSHAPSPYPSPYSEHPPQSAGSERPSTSPHPGEDHSGLPRVRSMMNMGSVDAYGFNPAQAEFAYAAAVDDHSGHANGMYGRAVRPSTSASSLSGSSSAANTPGGDGFGQAGPGADGADINRCE